MGKRELLLIVAFVLAGTVLYQFTAPPPAPGERSFSVGSLVDQLSRQIRGNRAAADATHVTTHPVDADVTELRVTLRSGNITIVGEDRADVEATLVVNSRASDEAEARKTADDTVLAVGRAGPGLVASVVYPEPGQQRASVTLKVPRRLAVLVDPSVGTLDVSGVASVELADARGTTKLTGIAGRVAGRQRGSELTITDAGAVKITARGADLKLETIRGDVSMTLTAGELTGTGLAGAVEVESTGTDVTLENLPASPGILRINASTGSVTIVGLRREARIDVRGTELSIGIDRAAPLTVYSDGSDGVEVTLPAGGYQLDAVTARGAFHVAGDFLPAPTEGPERRVSAAVGGGGPLLSIRTTRGDITLRRAETAGKAER